MRLDIRYRVHFRYDRPVQESHNEVRMRPREDRYQKVFYYRLRSQPPVRLLQAMDYWGTAVDHLGVRMSHTELELMAESTVETSPRPTPTKQIAIEALADPGFRSRYHEFLVPSRHVRWEHEDAVAQQALKAAEDAESVSEMIASVVRSARGALTYSPGSTGIGVSLSELLESGAGVCQDFTHLAVGMLRSVDVPACYVSGYLFAADETTPLGELLPGVADDDSTAGEYHAVEPDEVSVQTHAWIMAALPGHGWWALDPTNGSVAGERHVVVGYGRDYSDVPPVRGVFMGPSWSDVDSGVVIGRQNPDDSEWEHAIQHDPPHIVVQSRASSARRRNHRNSQLH